MRVVIEIELPGLKERFIKRSEALVLTPQEVIAASGIGKSTWQRLHAGKSRRLTVETILKIASALGIDLLPEIQEKVNEKLLDNSRLT